MIRLFTLLSIVFISHSIIAQSVIKHQADFKWDEHDPFRLSGAGELEANPFFPIYTFRQKIQNGGKIDVQLQAGGETSVNLPSSASANGLTNEFVAGAVIEQERNELWLRLWVVPFRNAGRNNLARLESANILISITPDPSTTFRNGPDYKSTSALAQGIIHKISVAKEGVFRIDYNFIKNQLQTDPATLDPQKIAVLGNGGGRIPQANALARVDDLEPVAIHQFGLEDGAFQPGDYILFYAEGPDKWRFDNLSKSYHMERNIYARENYYYINLNSDQTAFMQSRADQGSGAYISNTSFVSQRIEDEKVNLLGRFRPPGSGQDWYGDEMSAVNQLDFTNRFLLQDIVLSDTMAFRARFAVRTATNSRVYLRLGTREFEKIGGDTKLENYEANFAREAVISGSYIPNDQINQILVRYPGASGANSRAWIDYVQLNFWRNNIYHTGSPLLLRDPRTRYLGGPTFSVQNLPAGALIWDISYPQNPVAQQFNFATESKFTPPLDLVGTHIEFICFNPQTDVETPVYVGRVQNQNLHGINLANLLIIYYDAFEEAALKLANHRRQHSGMDVVAVPVSQVFEEFGGGAKDPSAIRDFVRMVYSRDPDFRYLLLIGDGTYDYLNHDPELPYHNYVPVFETEESLDPIRSFPSDDFFALLDDHEGGNLKGALDIAVGRLPSGTIDEANNVVNKIIAYDTNPATLHDWRNRTVLLADDEDNNTHLNQTEALAQMANALHPEYSQEKLYLDAFPQESTPGGDRYPLVSALLDQNIEKGALTITYIGHGGPNGWTQERVLGINQSLSYTNLNNLPLFITATCSFAGYDEPGFISAGEHLLSNPKGGAIGLMTTVRAVYSGSNARLTESVLERVYKADSPGIYPTIGEVLRRGKNSNSQDTLDNNARKFTVLGDPSMNLAIPKYPIVITHISDVEVGNGDVDTLSALETTTIKGVVRDYQDNLLSSFNGNITITVFDKEIRRKTLGNDAGSPVREYVSQNRQLFRGTASVINGEWSITFTLPKDIDFAFGKGKISMYAENGVIDAQGVSKDLVIGGVYEEGLGDDTPPIVKAFMNDNKFISGGITSADPFIYLELADDQGINVSGAGIGHDITAVLDGDNRNTYILNDFYKATLNDHRSGTVRFPLKGLSPGRHTLNVTAWDLANNYATDEIEFFVVNESGPMLENVFSFPNPAEDLVTIQFEHNRPGSDMDIRLDVFDAQGKLIATQTENNVQATGFRDISMLWDATDVLSGLYFYRLRVTFKQQNQSEVVDSKFGKLTIF